MIIEFIGLPASGKSTLVRHLLSNDLSEDLVFKNPFIKIYKQPWVKRNVKKAVYIFGYTLKNMKRVLKLIKMIILSKQRCLKDFLRVSFNFLFLLVLYEKYSKSNDIILFDEGFLHNIWAVIYSSRNKQVVLDTIFDFDLTPNIIIKVNCSSDIILERLMQRKSNTRIEKEGCVLNRIDQSKKDIDIIIATMKHISNYSSVKVFEFNNDDYIMLENNSNIIIKHLRERTNYVRNSCS